MCIRDSLYILKGGYLWWSGRYDDAGYMLRGAVRKAVSIGEPEPVKMCIRDSSIAAATSVGLCDVALRPMKSSSRGAQRPSSKGSFR